METRSVDLSQHRCPMSLLLAKRESQCLEVNEKLVIKVVDKGSLTDMMTYFQQNSFHIHVEHTEMCTLLTVTKK